MNSLTRAFDAAGVDYVQWRALMHAHTLVSLSALRGVHGPASLRRAWLGAAGMLVAFALIGSFTAAAAWLLRDLFLAATVTTGMAGALAVMTVAGQRPGVFEPEDYEIVGFRPISSRTYFAARASGVLIQVLGVTALSGWLPVLVFLARPDGSVTVAAMAILAMALSAIAAMCALFALYGVLARILRPASLAHTVALVQTGLPMLFGTLFVLPFLWFGFSDSLGDVRLLALPRSWWVLVLPPAWFGAYVEIARGAAGTFEWAAAALSLAALALTGVGLRGWMMTDYAGYVARMATAASSDGRPGYDWPFLDRERRAVVLLLASELRGNVTLQLATLFNLALAIALLGIVLLALGLPRSPFEPMVAGASNFSLVIFLLAFIQTPLMDRGLLSSDSAGASWMLYTTPSDRTAIVMATRDALAAVIFVPLLLVTLPLLVYAFGRLVEALVVALVIVLIGYLCLQIGFLVRPRLPLSIPTLPGQPGFQPAAGLLVSLLPMLTGILVFLFVTTLMSRAPAWALAATIALTGAVPLLNTWTRRRVTRALPRYLEA
jgi:hypothetical protein